jgi:PKD repeat protein
MKSILWRLAVLTLVAYAPLPAQTARDTAHKATCDDRMAAALRTEALRNNVRKGVVRAVADTLTRCGVALVAPTTQPPPVNQPPVAAFTLACDNATRLCRVTNQSTDPEAGTLTYRTTWGDGSVSTALNPSHTYAATGSYTVALTATDPLGLAATMTRVATLTAPAPTNTAPVAQFTAACVDLTRVCAVNGSASTDDKSVTGYAWAFGDGATASGVTASHTYALPGAYTIRLTARDLEGLTATRDTTVAFAPPVIDTIVPPPPPPPPPPDTTTIATRANLPRSIPNPVFGAATRTVPVFNGANLQTAFDAAQDGDSLVLVGSFTGEFLIPPRPCGGKGITITSAGPAIPVGTRVTPTMATGFAKLVTASNQPALRFSHPTCGWRLNRIEITTTYQSLQYWLFALGGDGLTSVSLMPTQIELSHMYVHGQPTSNVIRCLALNSTHTVIRDSWFSDCHAKGFDSQAIEGWAGQGPYLIENNYLEGAGENMMFGGADPPLVGLTPSDITIRHNHFFKDPAWKDEGWSIKNLLEFKNARRVLVEANVFENSWPSSQAGMAIVVKSSHDACGTCTWQGTEDLTFRYNIVRSAHRGLNLQAVDGESDFHVARVTVEHNWFDRIGAVNGFQPNDGWLMLFTHDLKDILVNRNTFVGNAPGYGLALFMDYANGAARRIEITDNVLAGQSYYAIGYSGMASGVASLRAFAGDSWRFAGNIVSVVDVGLQGVHPVGNTYLTSFAQVGVTATGTTNYPTKGADIGELTKRTLNVVVAP